MISIIICSRNAIIATSLTENISETVGVEYELIIIDNSENRFSIFQAYNEGVKRARYSYLCFMHDDILFYTNNWGKALLHHFTNNSSIGLIGYIGTHFIPSVPSYWTSGPFVTVPHMEPIDNHKYLAVYDDFKGENHLVEAVACDGMWFCTPSKLFEKISFDDQTFSGFHLYDMDICMQILNCGYRVCICNDISIGHSAQSKADDIFYRNRDLFFEKWEKKLPINRGIEYISDEALNRTNDLYKALYKLEKEKSSIYTSKAYRAGKFLLKPISLLRSLFLATK